MTPAAWFGVVDALIEERRPIQSAFPTIGEIRSAYAKYIKDNPQAAPPINYDPDEDHRFPVSKMWGGFHLLEKTNSVDQFNAYADRVRMPTRDRERVMAKWKRCYGHNITVNDDWSLSVAGPS